MVGRRVSQRTPPRMDTIANETRRDRRKKRNRQALIDAGYRVIAEKGIDAVLAGRASLDEVRVSVRRPALDLYPAIEPRRNAHELLVLSRFARVIKELEQRHAIVLIDTPPTLIVPDTSLILQHVGACIPIARAGQTRARLFRQLIDVLPRGKLLGELLNGVRTPAHDFGYYYADDDGHTKPSRAPGVK